MQKLVGSFSLVFYINMAVPSRGCKLRINSLQAMQTNSWNKKANENETTPVKKTVCLSNDPFNFLKTSFHSPLIITGYDLTPRPAPSCLDSSVSGGVLGSSWSWDIVELRRLEKASTLIYRRLSV